MPPKKKVYAKSKKSYTSNRTQRRAITKSRYGKFKQTVHHFKRWGETLTFDPQIGTGVSQTLLDGNYWLLHSSDTAGTFSFQLNNVADFTEFTSLYDQYRINKVVVKMFPCCNTNPQQMNWNTLGPTNNSVNSIYAPFTNPVMSVIDYDDKLILNRDTMLSYSKLKHTAFPKPISVMFTPAIQNVVSKDTTDTTAQFIATNPKFKQWLSTDHADVQHLGLKVYVPGVGNAGLISTEAPLRRYDIRICYYLSFRNVK